jgi:hypothetical protein
MLVEHVGYLTDILKNRRRIFIGIYEIFVVLVPQEGFQRCTARADASLPPARRAPPCFRKHLRYPLPLDGEPPQHGKMGRVGIGFYNPIVGKPRYKFPSVLAVVVSLVKLFVFAGLLGSKGLRSTNDEVTVFGNGRTDNVAQPFAVMLIQAKWDDTLNQHKKDFRNQAIRMQRRSDESYVWVYGPQGVRVIPAKRAGYPQLPPDFMHDNMSVGELITDGLRCNAGDPRIGRDLNLPPAMSMNTVMRRLSARRALDFSIKQDD